MQPVQAEALGIEMRRSVPDADRFAVSSRRHALDWLRDAIPCGPVLITGESGVGKTWLVRCLVEGLPTGWQTAELEMSSALDGVELLRLAGAELGLAIPDRLGAARLRLGAGLRDAAADGRSWLLIVDEAQRATADAWEELQAVSNQLGRPGGFAALILMGRSELARKLVAPRRHGWTSRLVRHIHLPPLDLDEARQLLGREGLFTEPELERIHRDSLGNPRVMLRLAEVRERAHRSAAATPAPTSARPVSSPRLPYAYPESQSRRLERSGDSGAPTAVATPAPAEEAAPPRLPPLIPARPPIRVEDGLVEVGWEGDLESEPTLSDSPPTETGTGPPVEAGPSEERVEDRYAALQAWEEWSRNRERSSAPAIDRSSPRAEVATGDGADPGMSDEARRGDAGTSAQPSVRAEASHDFAPYSQLFGRLRHSL